jgi:ubiquinone/menaquinone biosynthesis C-methylase UbiE
MMAKIQEPSRIEIWKMFNQYATTYDLSNRVMTRGFKIKESQ